jgi:hypothetical protein
MPLDWVPVFGTWLSGRTKPKGSKADDYSYELPVPCDDIDKAFCVRAIDAQAVVYITDANSTGVIGVAIDAAGAFIGLFKGLPGWLVSAVLSLDAAVKIDIIFDNTNSIRAGADAAKRKCGCCPKKKEPILSILEIT